MAGHGGGGTGDGDEGGIGREEAVCVVDGGVSADGIYFDSYGGNTC